MTYRDANAAWMSDFLDFRRPAFREPPVLAAAPSPLGGRGCDTADPNGGGSRAGREAVAPAELTGS